MKTKAILTIITYCISFAFSFPDERKNRMFSLFNVVKFKNSECQATSSTTLQGVCHTSEECDDLGGTADGNCAASFGVCCVVKVNTCGGTVTQNASYIESVGFPTVITTAGSCAYTVTRCSSDICQVRLDFINTVLQQPAAATGLCADTLTIAPGGGTTVSATQAGTADPPVICGTISSGTHMYLDAGTANTAATVTFSTAAIASQTWRIRVSQVECFSPNKAPNGCLQYFYGDRKHTVTSFNFDGTACTGTGCMIQKQDYRVCFRQEEGMCGVQYSESQLTTGDAFLLTNAAATALITAANCGTGFLQIRNVQCQACDVAASNPIDTFCGSNLAALAGGSAAEAGPNALNAIGTPFEFRVVARVAGGTASAQNTLPGFSVDAVQIPCSSAAAGTT
jgi:hypothetical protein